MFGLLDIIIMDNQAQVIHKIEIFQHKYPNIKAKAVSCGTNHTMIIDLNNNVWAFGSNNFGQLGLGDNQYRLIPTQIPNIKAKSVSCSYHTMIIDLNNNVWAFGQNDHGQLGLGDRQDRNIPTQIPNIKAKTSSCGHSNTILILSPSPFGSNVHLIDFNEAARKLTAGEFLNFNFLPEYQVIPHKPGNYIASFYGKDGNIYLVESEV